MINLVDMGAMFWRFALGGSDPLLGYENTFNELEGYRGTRTVLCCDSPKSARKEKHPSYKSNRKPKPPGAIEALEGAIERARLWFPVAKVDGWEADDVVCTLAHQAWPEDVTIVGSEKDFFYLIDERVTLLGVDGTRHNAQRCLDKFGVAPSQMREWLAMVGDAADGIEGCPECGPVKASKLLSMFGSLAEVKAAIAGGALQKGTLAGIGEKTLKALHEWDPTVALELVSMRSDLPIQLFDLLECL